MVAYSLIVLVSVILKIEISTGPFTKSRVKDCVNAAAVKAVAEADTNPPVCVARVAELKDSGPL